MLVVDILHEWDIGGGKAIVAHLFRILEVIKQQDSHYSSILGLLDERQTASFPVLLFSLPANYRFRAIPSFGTTVRKFSRNVSEMKKMTGHGVAAVLQVPGYLSRSFSASADSTPSFAIQCSIPAFCGLFPNPQHDSCI
jgi:hypothetical protein